MALIVTGCSGSKDHKSAADLSHQFEAFFGFKPSADIVEIRARSVWVGDAQVEWISFRCSSNTFERVVQSHHYAIAQVKEIEQRRDWQVPDVDSHNRNAPSWWPEIPSAGMTKLYWLRGQSSTSTLWREEKTGIVFACYSATY
jgi:hypothetical protein